MSPVSTLTLSHPTTRLKEHRNSPIGTHPTPIWHHIYMICFLHQLQKQRSNSNSGGYFFFPLLIDNSNLKSVTKKLHEWRHFFAYPLSPSCHFFVTISQTPPSLPASDVIFEWHLSNFSGSDLHGRQIWVSFETIFKTGPSLYYSS